MSRRVRMKTDAVGHVVVIILDDAKVRKEARVVCVPEETGAMCEAR